MPISIGGDDLLDLINDQSMHLLPYSRGEIEVFSAEGKSVARGECAGLGLLTRLGIRADDSLVSVGSIADRAFWDFQGQDPESIRYELGQSVTAYRDLNGNPL